MTTWNTKIFVEAGLSEIEIEGQVEFVGNSTHYQHPVIYDLQLLFETNSIMKNMKRKSLRVSTNTQKSQHLQSWSSQVGDN